MTRRLLPGILALLFAFLAGAHADETAVAARLGALGGKVRRNGLIPGAPIFQVDLQASRAVDADLALLPGLKRLRILYLGHGTKITDVGMAFVGKISSLKELYLPETAITDVGLAHAAKLTRLRKLGLTGCKGITDRGLVHLKGLKGLKEVALYGTGVTEAGARDLQQALPDATIGGGERVPPAGAPSRAARKQALKKAEAPDVGEEMLDFMSCFDGTEQGARAAMKYVASGPDVFDLSGIRIESPHVLKMARQGDLACYTLQVRQGIARATYLVCWGEGTVRRLKQVSLSFD